LFVDGSKTPLKTLKGDDIVSIVSGGVVAFVDLSKTLEKDKVTKFTLKALLEDSEVTALGKKIRFVVDSNDGIETVRKADDSVITDIKGATIN
jgi:Trp operon repressor